MPADVTGTSRPPNGTIAVGTLQVFSLPMSTWNLTQQLELGKLESAQVQNNDLFFFFFFFRLGQP